MTNDPQHTSFQCWCVFWLVVISKVTLVTVTTTGLVRLLTLERKLPTVDRKMVVPQQEKVTPGMLLTPRLPQMFQFLLVLLLLSLGGMF